MKRSILVVVVVAIAAWCFLSQLRHWGESSLPLEQPSAVAMASKRPETVEVAIASNSRVEMRSPEDDGTDALGGISLEVVVVSEEGVPVVGAEVTLQRALSAKTKSLRTNSDGLVGFEVLSPGVHQVQVASSGYSYLEKDVAIDVAKQIRITVQAGWALSGLILDRSGRPIEQEVLLLARPSRYAYATEYSKGRSGRSSVSTVSGRDGTFTFEHLSPTLHYYISVLDDSLVEAHPLEAVDFGFDGVYSLVVDSLAAVALEIGAGNDFWNRGVLNPYCLPFNAKGHVSMQSEGAGFSYYASSDSDFAMRGRDWVRAAPNGTQRRLSLVRLYDKGASAPATVQVSIAYGGFHGVSTDAPIRMLESAISQPTRINLESTLESQEWGELQIYLSFPPGLDRQVIRGFLGDTQVSLRNSDGVRLSVQLRPEFGLENQIISLPCGEWEAQVFALSGSFRFPESEWLTFRVDPSVNSMAVPVDHVSGVQFTLLEGDGARFTGSALVLFSRQETESFDFLRFKQAPYRVWGLAPGKWEFAAIRIGGSGTSDTINLATSSTKVGIDLRAGVFGHVEIGLR